MNVMGVRGVAVFPIEDPFLACVGYDIDCLRAPSGKYNDFHGL
jgi:hypothetical protein